MKGLLIKITTIVFGLLIPLQNNLITPNKTSQDFKGQAYYMSKTRMDLGNWGARLSEAQKKQVAARMQGRLEKTYILTFNKEESLFKEEDKLDALSGATDSWGKNFTPGAQYKNIKTITQIQNQEFYGKQFLVKDSLQPITWKITGEKKKIGKYNCFKATALITSNELTWYAFSWDKLRTKEKDASEAGDDETELVEITQVEAWFTPQIPVGHGPLEYWGLAGLILEVSAGDTTLLCSKLILNAGDEVEIAAPKKGTEVTKLEYQDMILNKMKEFRDNRGGRGR
ncbi:MAG: GLPGLI family protein [Lacinutrix sp.]|uniref:GLPGLI family protein n=1 Tax=Lacinutrix sp. TaxID=1937692 RepID=UPI0030B4FF46